MLIVLAVSIAGCLIISLVSHDPPEAIRGLGWSALIVLTVGGVGMLLTRGPVELTRRDGFAIVTFGWIAASIAGALPFLLAGTIQSPAAAVFESMSGFTTTGASVLSNLELIPKGIMFWRALTHFFGGMGVLVLCVAIIPFLGTGGMQIFRAEVPGPSKDRLTPRIASTAKLLWGIYVGLCLAQAVLLKLGGMSWFDAFCHSFATMATGGFSTRSASVGAFDNAYIETVIIVFMFLAGTNFALHLRALRGDIKGVLSDPELRFYFAIWLGACVLVSLDIWGDTYTSLGHSIRAGFFQVTSIMTTTGFVTEDFDLWPGASQVLLVLLMFIGGCAGSTGGGIKNIRILVVLKKMVREIRLFMQPQAVLKIKVGRQALSERDVSHITAFFMLFVVVFALASWIMTFFTPDLATAVTSAIATLGNIGPGLAGVGATQTYAAIPAPGHIVLTICMLLGRLELYTVLIVLQAVYWRR